MLNLNAITPPTSSMLSGGNRFADDFPNLSGLLAGSPTAIGDAFGSLPGLLQGGPGAAADLISRLIGPGAHCPADPPVYGRPVDEPVYGRPVHSDFHTMTR